MRLSIKRRLIHISDQRNLQPQNQQIKINHGPDNQGKETTRSSVYRPINIEAHNQFMNRRQTQQNYGPQPRQAAVVTRVQRYVTGPRTFTMPPGLNDLSFSIRPADYPNSVIYHYLRNL